MTTSEFIRMLITNYEQGQNLKNINFGIDKIIKQLEELKKEIPEVEDISSRIEDKNEDAFAVSRNALCPCGSGSKYKHCCGQIKD